MERLGCVLIIPSEIRTVPDAHLLRRVQAFQESLGRKNWFSLLEQGKAYHQGYMTAHYKDSVILQGQY